MAKTKEVDMNRSRQKGFPWLLGASLAGMLPAFHALAQTDNGGAPLHGFADVGYAAHSKQSANPKGFNVGSLDLYLTPQFDDNLKALIELIFETTHDG